LLGSDQPGEVLGSVKAMGRVLSASKLDWHGLAAVLAPGESEDWHDQLAYCSLHMERLKDKERDFLRSYRDPARATARLDDDPGRQAAVCELAVQPQGCIMGALATSRMSGLLAQRI